MTEAAVGATEPAYDRRLLAGDVALIGVYLVLAATLISLSLAPPHATPLWSMLLVTVVGVAVLLARRRRPDVAFAATLGLMLVSFAGGTGLEVFLVIPFLYRAGLERSARSAGVAFAVTTAAAAVAAAILANRLHLGPSLLGLAPREAEQRVTGWASVFLPIEVGALIVTLLGVSIGNRRRLVAALTERAEQMKRERDQGVSIARASERERIAREMHDVIAHSLAVMIALADGAQAASARRPEQSQEAVARIAEMGRRTLGEVRRLLGTVSRDPDHSDYAPPSLGQLPAIVAEFNEAGLPVRLETSGELINNSAVGWTIYRIVQESLTNVLRHGRDVREVRVRVTVVTREIAVEVEDSSAPALLPDTPGRGLIGMRERAALYDGTVDAGPRPGGGWRVFVRLRLDE